MEKFPCKTATSTKTCRAYTLAQQADEEGHAALRENDEHIIQRDKFVIQGLIIVYLALISVD